MSGWREGEREELLRQIAEREQRNHAERIEQLLKPLMSEPSDTEPEAPTMTTSQPLDGAGRVIQRGADASRPHMPDRAWIDRRIQSQLKALADAVGLHLGEIRDDIARLRSEIAELRQQLDLQRQLATMQTRLARLEDGSGAVTTGRPLTNGAHSTR